MGWDGMEWNGRVCHAWQTELGWVGLVYKHRYGLYCLSSLLGILDCYCVGLKWFGNSSLGPFLRTVSRIPREKGFTRISQHTLE